MRLSIFKKKPNKKTSVKRVSETLGFLFSFFVSSRPKRRDLTKSRHPLSRHSDRRKNPGLTPRSLHSTSYHRHISVGVTLAILIAVVIQSLMPQSSTEQAFGAAKYERWTTRGDFLAGSADANTIVSGVDPANDATLSSGPPQINLETTSKLTTAGSNSSYEIKTDGTLWSWGVNNHGQLGLGDTTNRSVPTQVGSETNWESVFPGTYHSLAIKADGTLWAWGYNGSGQLGLGDTIQRLVPTQVGTDTSWKMVSANGNNFDTNGSQTIAIKTNGTLWAWGHNGSGQLGLGDTTQRLVPTQVGLATTWKMVTTVNTGSSLAIMSDGTLWSWGNNSAGQLGLGDTTQRLVPTQVGLATNWNFVSVGGYVFGSSYLFVLATKTDGTLWAWGNNSVGQLGIGNTTQQISPVQVGSATTWKMVAAGIQHSLAIKSDGTLWSWGNNGHGQLGLGDGSNRLVPTQVGAENTWVAPAAGGNVTMAGNTPYSLATKNNGTLWAWGNNTYGQLGLGDAVMRSAPNQVGIDLDWRGYSISYPSFAITSGLTKSLTSKSSFQSANFALTEPLPAGSGVTISARAADSPGGVAGATWYDATSQMPLADDDSVCMALSASANRECYTVTVNGPGGGGTLMGTDVEMKITLTSDGTSTPTFDGLQLNYEELTKPDSVLSYRSDGTTEITTGATNESSIKVNADLEFISGPAGLNPEIWVRPDNTSFTGSVVQASGVTEDTPNIDQSASYSGYVGTINGLSPNIGYYYKVRYTDGAGRQSAWSDPVGPITIDQTSPTLGTFTVAGNTDGSATWVNGTNDHSLIQANLQLSDNLSPSVDVQFSYDGTSWSAYNGATDGTGSNTEGNNWEAGSFKTISANTTHAVTPKIAIPTAPATQVYNIKEAWKLTDTTPNKPIYVRVRDAGGNLSVDFRHTTNTDFNLTGSDNDSGKVVVSNDSLSLRSSNVGDFESGTLSGWTTSSVGSVIVSSGDEYLISGNYSAKMYGNYSEDCYPVDEACADSLNLGGYVYTDFVVPSNFTLSISTRAMIGGTYDRDRISIYNLTSGGALVKQWDTGGTQSGSYGGLATSTNVNTPVSATLTYDMAALAGKTVRVYARAHNGGWAASLSIDNINFPSTVETQGSYNSSTINLGYSTSVTQISWINFAKPADSNVKFQIASKSSDSGWVDSDYIGPDGTASTFYTTSSGQSISSHHADKQYVRYKAILNSDSTHTQTPVLDSVTISSAKKASNTLSLDTTPPSDLAVPTFAAADDAGSSPSDGITKYSTNLTFTGTGDAGSTIQLYDGSTPVGPATAVASYTNPGIDLSLSEGVHQINARAIDPAGNVSTNASPNTTITVDLTAPEVITQNATINSGTGWNTDYIAQANQSAAKLSGVKTADTNKLTIALTDGTTTKTNILTGLDEQTTFNDQAGIDTSAATALVDGKIGYTITATDTAGNDRVQTVAKVDSNLYKDTVSPANASITLKSGSVYTKTNLNVPLTVSATDTDGSGVKEYQLSNDGTNFGKTVRTSGEIFDAGWIDYTGNQNYAWNLTTSDGTKNVYVKFRDRAGNGTGSISTQTDWDTGTRGTDVAKQTGGVYLLKANGMAATVGTECASGYVSGGVCAVNPIPTVTIGTQTWMAKNLDITVNPSGTPITRYCYDNNPTNCTTYGGLYDWATAMNGSATEGAQGICPVGYHLPTDSEWKILEMYYGMTQVQADATNWRGTNQGTLLKAVPFSAVLGGGRLIAGNYTSSNFDGYFWSSSVSGTSAWLRLTRSTEARVNRYTIDKAYGFSVRCIQDAGGNGPGGSGPAGTFVSPIKDLGTGAGYTSMSWNAPTSPSTISMLVKYGTDTNADNSPDTWSGWLTSTDASLIGKRWVQYQATLSFNGGSNTPVLSSVMIDSAATDSIILDTTPPKQPTAVDLVAADDSGALNGDDITSVKTNLHFRGVTGSVEAGNDIEVFDTFNLRQTKLNEGTTVTSTGSGDNGAWEYIYPGTLADGLHQITVVTTDQAENSSQTSTTLNLVIDTTTPAQPSIISIPAGTSGAYHWNQNYVAEANKTAVKVNGGKASVGAQEAATNGVVQIDLTFADNDQFTNSITKTLTDLTATDSTYTDSVGLNLTTLAEGKIAYRVVAHDTAGNQTTREVLKAASTLTKDVYMPGGTFALKGGLLFDNSSYANTANVKIDLADPAPGINDGSGSGLLKVRFSNNGVLWPETWTTWPDPLAPISWDLTDVTYGGNTDQGVTKTVYAQFEDKAGNTTYDYPNSDDIIYDTIAPASVTVTAQDSISSQNIPESSWRTFTQPEFTWTDSSDQAGEGSGVKEFRYCLSQNSDCIPSIIKNTSDRTLLTDLAAQSDGTWYMRVAAVDNADNWSTIDTFSYYYDRTPPAPTGVSNFTAASNGGSIKFTWDTADLHNGAPIHYVVERIYASVYANGFPTDNTDLGPDKIWNTTNQGYASMTYPDNGCTVTESTITCYDNTVDQGRMYNFRIHAYDESVDAAGDQQVGPVQSYAITAITTDNTPPEFPTVTGTVTATACSYQHPEYCSNAGNDTLKGHENMITWDRGDDHGGTGIYRYLVYRSTSLSTVEGNYTLIKSLEVDPNDTTTPSYTFYDNTTTSNDHLALSDWTYYYYRVVAQDGPPTNNKSAFAPSENIFANSASSRTADVTTPSIPTSVAASPLGPDDSRVKQKVQITWTRSTDNNAISGYKLYKSATAGGVYTDITANPAVYCNFLDANETIRSAGFTSPKCTESGLDDFTNYYYKVVSVDAAPFLNQSALSSYGVVRTASSAVPTAVKGPRVDGVRLDQPRVAATKGNPSNDAVGHEITINFAGSYAKNCDPVLNTRCLTKYELYRSTTNYQLDSDWIANADMIHEETPRVKDNDRESDYSYTDAGLLNATTYYYKVLAIDNSPVDPDQGPFSTFSNIVVGTMNAGWDITPDDEAPVADAASMAIKVKDTYPKAGVVRNILTWLVPETPTRPKQSYETCSVVKTVGGIDHCSDFAKYEIWRSVDNMQGLPNSVDEYPIAEITDLSTNLYTDEASDLLKDFKFRYFIVIYDNAGTAFRYDAPISTEINKDFSNKTAKIYAEDSIVPANSHAVVSNVTLTNVSVSSATVNWNTDQDTDSLVEYRPMSLVNNTWVIDDSNEFVAVGHRERLPQHSVYIFGLKPNTKYEYRVISKNYPFANETVVSSGLPDLTTTGFNIAPTLTTTTTSTAEISWTTNLDASSAFVEYQLQRQPGDDAQSGTAGVTIENLSAKPKNHTVVVKGLRSNRTFTYKIKSISKDGYTTEYPGGEFATFKTRNFDSDQFTIAPNSSNVAERNINATTAQIVWETSVPATSWVDYSTTSGVYDVSSGNNDLVTTHVVLLEGLVPGNRYYYRVRVKDANEVEYTSAETSFVAILKPKISNMKIKDVTPYSATISWDTNVDTETVINWGKTAGYGEKKGTQGLSKVHEIKVEGLEDNQEYHYQILAKDEAGNEVADEDKMVRTPLDTEGPKITGVKIDVLPMGESDSTSSIIVSWTTNKPATTLVEYGEGVIGGTYDKRSVEDLTLNNSHTVIIKGLTPASSYHYRLVSADKRNNKTVSQDYTFVTPSKEKSILQLILKSLEETFSWTKNLNQFFGNIGKRLTGR